jgi:hypothetical protein
VTDEGSGDEDSGDEDSGDEDWALTADMRPTVFALLNECQ